MNSPYRVHSALPSSADAKTIPFPVSPKPQPAQAGRAPPAPPSERANKLAILLKLEGEIRQLPTRPALSYHAVNESRALLEHAQSYFFRMNRRDSLTMEAVADIAQPDLKAPLVTAITSVVNRLAEPAKHLAFDLHKLMRSKTHPHKFALWLPMIDAKGKAFAGLLLLRDQPWPDDVIKIGERLAGAYGFAIRAQTPPMFLRSVSFPRWALYGGPVLAVCLALVPVPLTALAPFEVVPLDPIPVTAPIDGVVSMIAVEPNAAISAQQVLFRLDATNQKAEQAIAEQNVLVAQARLATTRNGAFSDKDMKRALSVTEKELELAKAELANAESRMSRTAVASSASGVVVFASRSELMGKPVRVGERVMDIADPKRVAYRIELGIHDAIALGQNAGVRLFLDADPLNPRAAEIVEESYHAVQTDAGPLAFIVKAKPADGEEAVRLGLRGTAQLSGEKVSLGFYLFRRPIAALRQHFGF